jgi:hypothetical protein
MGQPIGLLERRFVRAVKPNNVNHGFPVAVGIQFAAWLTGGLRP